MPADPIVSAIVSSIIGSVLENAMTPPPEPIGVGIVRTLPGETRKGVLTQPKFGQVTIDGKPLQLSPGAQIRNELNMIVMPSMVQGPVKVRYMVDLAGFVYRIWILSATEASLPENR
jgi:hypothetical protein